MAGRFEMVTGDDALAASVLTGPDGVVFHDTTNVLVPPVHETWPTPLVEATHVGGVVTMNAGFKAAGSVTTTGLSSAVGGVQPLASLTDTAYELAASVDDSYGALVMADGKPLMVAV